MIFSLRDCLASIDDYGVIQAVCVVVILIVAAQAMGELFSRLRQPRVIGEIVGGLLLGPTCLGYISPGVADSLVPETRAGAALLPVLSQCGLVLLMYASGRQLRSFLKPGEKRTVATVAVAGISIPFLTGLAMAPFVNAADLLGPANNRTALWLVLATAVAIASIPVISRIMLDLGILETSFGRIVIAAAVMDDIVLYIVLAAALGLVQAHAGPEQGLPALLGLDPASPWTAIYHALATIAAMALILAGAPPLLRRVFRMRWPGLRWDNAALPQVIFLLITVGLSMALNVDPLFGALAAGMAVGRTSEDLGVSRSIARCSHGLLIPFYFALVGFKLDLVHHCNWVFFVQFLLVACAVKFVSVYAGARLAGEAHPAAVNLAVALNCRGGPGIVLASVAFDAGIINEDFFCVLVLVVVATSLAAGSWLGRAVRQGTFSEECEKPQPEMESCRQ
jgi:Kef-type K+ transport system membrane component KefB